MRRITPAVVDLVARGSLAAQAGLAPGDRILRVNGKAPRDYIAYRYLIAEPRVRLLVEHAVSAREGILIEKAVDQDLGLRFTEDVFDGIISCGNRCAFCFVAQLPRGLRPALYVRDDDYRLSFLHGNFITLTNLTPADRARIVRDNLSPLYVSIHATDPQARRALFGRATPDPLAELQQLGKRGIRFHTQIVICPSYNDGEVLAQTVHDLAALYPMVQSIGIVPVGLTKHRRDRRPLPRVTKSYARRLLRQVSDWQHEFLSSLETRLVFAADEWYLLTGALLPERCEYETFPQYDNGIGCARRFLDSIQRVQPVASEHPVSVALVTGEMAAPLVRELAAALAGPGVQATTVVVPNKLLGRTVTTAGLLAGRDIAAVLQRRPGFDIILVPGTAVREGVGFLDDMTLPELYRMLGTPVIAATTPGEAAAALRKFVRKNKNT
jgi:putative radical SAM enzyme (TIGR03279 family)